MDLCRVRAEEREKGWLSSHGAFSVDHCRLLGPEDDYRLPYKRDVDRILHSKAYARYTDKTQVAYLIENDHITHRGLHVQLVSSFSRGIGEILRLNLDLIEAISLGHDVGHPPFGHEGEGYLSALSIEFGQKAFAHPVQSCRLFSLIESLRLGFAVYDGFLCHDGGIQEPILYPSKGKTWGDHFGEIEAKKDNPDVSLMPSTLEGCLVKICDTISYIGKDIDDAISLGILQREMVPKTILGTTNREMLNALAIDIITHSEGKPYIALSEHAFEALKQLRAFNFKHIYVDPRLKKESKKIEAAYRLLFTSLYEDLIQQKERSYLWRHFLENKRDSYRLEISPEQQVIDYIAGMTDTFFVRTLEKLFIPSGIQISLL